MARSVTIRTAEISPKDSNSLLSQSSSTFHDKEPTKRFFGFSSSAAGFSTLAFFAEGTDSVSALRFFESDASDSEPDSEPDSESESEPDSEVVAALVALVALGFLSDSESDESEPESESESESEDWERKTLG